MGTHHRLFHGEVCLGTLVDLEHDWPWMWAVLQPEPAAAAYAEFFRYITNEATDLAVEPPFPPELLDDERWTIRDEAGETRGIFVPAVHADGTVAWRWRDP